MKTRAWLGTLVMLMALVGFVQSASATLISPGTSGAAPDIFGFSPGGTLLADTGIQPYTTSAFSGLYQSRVFADAANPICAGCLDFVYMFSNDDISSNDPLHRATVANFKGFTTDAGFDDTSVGVAPASIDRSASGKSLAFNFEPVPDGVGPGQQSRVLVVYTDATRYVPGTLALINSQSINLQGFSPSAVPEPGTLFLLGSGLAGLVGSRFIRKRHVQR